MSVETAAATGDRRQALEAMRTALARAMDEAEASVIAQVSARLQAVLKDLDELGAARREVDGLDEIFAARAARAAKADGRKPATRTRRKPAS